LLTAANTPLLVSFMSVVFLRVLLSFPTRRSSDLSGVTFLRPETSYLEASVEIAEGAMIYPGVTLLGKTKIGAGSVIESGCFLKKERKSTRLNSSHVKISYAVFCLKKKKHDT